MAIVTLSELKVRLGIVEDTDNQMLEAILEESQSFIEGSLGYAIPANHPKDLHFAVAATAAHFYENREATVVGLSIVAAPLSVQDIIANRRNYWGFTDVE